MQAPSPVESIPTILVIDDDTQVREMLSEYLSSMGYAVITANDGHEGIESFRLCEPDLVITDIVMPGHEGVELVQMIKEHNSEVPVIVISGGSSRFAGDYLDYAVRFGANEKLAKPFELGELQGMIEKHLPA